MSQRSNLFLEASKLGHLFILNLSAFLKFCEQDQSLPECGTLELDSY
jgi:hypothetical protein